MLKDHPNIEGIELHSPGGRADEGLALGKLIRASGLLPTYAMDVQVRVLQLFPAGVFVKPQFGTLWPASIRISLAKGNRILAADRPERPRFHAWPGG